jgi:O-methyltransferase involved in polyketide biosynthesis
MAAAGFQPAAQTAWLAEGLLVYLSFDEAARMLTAAGDPPRAAWSRSNTARELAGPDPRPRRGRRRLRPAHHGATGRRVHHRRPPRRPVSRNHGGPVASFAQSNHQSGAAD